MTPDPDESPIAFLKEHERDTATDFVARVRRKIDRRATASQFASYSWLLPKAMLIELAAILSHIFSNLSGKRKP
jgi:hypothetical protein